MQMQEKFEKMFGGSKKAKNESSSSLQRFLDLRRDPGSRFKHLRFVLESMPNPSERKTFLEQHSFESYHLFHELICQIEAISSQHLGPRLAVQELECALWLLETLFFYLPELVSQRWQYTSIGLVMKALLHPQNLLGVRRLAMRLFIQWYQILGVGPYGNQELDPYFNSLVPFLPAVGNEGQTTDKILAELCEQAYIRNSSNRRGQFSDASSIGAVSYLSKKPIPFTSTQSVDRTLSGAQNLSKGNHAQACMEKLLEYISADVTKIVWSGNRSEIQKRCLRLLMEKLRRCYVTICVTDPSSTQFDIFRPKLLSPSALYSGNSTISVASTIGDDPLTACRHAVIRWVAVYAFSHKKAADSLNNTGATDGAFGVPKDGLSQSPSPRNSDAKLPPNFDLIRECLFGSKPMINFVFTMFRESFLLPIMYASTMGRVFKTLREWLFMEERPPFFNEPTSPGNNLEPFAGLQSTYMAILYVLASFFYNPYLYKDEDRATLLVQISAKILALFKYMACNSCQLSQDTWQYLLKSLINIVTTNIPVSPPINIDRSQQPILVQRLSGHLFQTLLIAWVYAGLYSCVPNEMWDELLETLSARTSWPELICEWGKVVESVTRALGVGVYGVDVLDLPLERLSEQKMIRRFGATKSQMHDAQEKSVAPNIGNVQVQGDNGLNVGKPMYDFVQGSPMSNGPIPQVGQGSVGGQSVGRRSDVSGTSGTVRSKGSVGSSNRQVANSGSPPQLLPDETSLDGSNSVDSSGPTGSSNDCEIHGDAAREGLFESELLATTATSGEDGDDSVSEEFTVAEDIKGICNEGDEANVDEGSVISACGSTTVYLVWKRILGCLGDINQLQKPESHLGCLQLLEQLTANLFKIRDNQNVDTTSQNPVTPPTIVPHQTVIATWLLNALRLSERYHESKVIAMRLLCRIVVDHQRVAPTVDPLLQAQFFAVLHESLMSGVDEITGTILTECGAKVFACSNVNSGTLLLLCDFIRGASLLLNSGAVPKSDRMASAKFLSAVACLPSYLVSHFPCIASDWNLRKVRCGLVQNEILQLLLRSIRSNVEKEIKVESVKGIGLYLADRLSRGLPMLECESEECIQVLLETLPVVEADIGLLICGLLQPLRELCSLEEKANAARRIVEWLAKALEHALRSLTSSKVSPADALHGGRYATRLALDLVEWCECFPLHQASSSPAAVVWNLVEICYSCLSQDGEEHGHRHGLEASLTIAELFLTFLTSKFNQGGPTQSFVKESSVGALEDHDNDSSRISHNKPLVLSLRGRVILSMQQRHSVSRLIFRHGGGRRCWDMASVRRLNNEEIPHPSKFSSWLLRTLLDGSNSDVSSEGLAQSINSVGKRDGRDSLERLMRHLNTTSPECFASPPSFDQPISDYCFSTAVSEASVAAGIGQLNLKSKTRSATEPMNLLREDQNFVNYHILLGNSGQVDWDSHRRTELSTLEKNSERLQRELKHLDGLLLSEAHKIAVLYVADGQEDKQSILANRRGSQVFEDFVSGLGWDVDLKNHCGYAGGLSADVHLTTTYFCTATSETVFHVSTRLPNDDATKNLRHLGNDEVHIVWSEHWRDYRRSIIATEFCDVLIVIYPLDTIPFYKIHVDKRAGIGEFGPLADGMLVPWSALATLVRFTAINASRAKRLSVANYKNFYEHRLDTLHQAIEKLHAHSSYGNLLSSLLNTGSDVQQHSNSGHKASIRSA